MKQDRNRARRGLLAIFLIVCGIAVLFPGCGKKEALREGQAAAATETKSGESQGVGEKEESGIVTLSRETQKSSGIEARPVIFESATLPLSATAVIEMNMDRAAKISSRVAGKAVRITASQGDRVQAGQPLAYIESVELNQIWADYLKAQGKVALAQKSLQREETLFQKKISPEKDVLKARQELGEVEADLNLAQERFRLVGVDVAQYESAKGNGIRPLCPVLSPLGGVVVEKLVTQGEVVNPDKTLFMVADLSTLWVVIDVYEKDISRLRNGAGVKVSVAALGDRKFRGKISYIADVVDEKTRTEKARVTIDNASGLLKPGMFATVLTETTGGSERLLAVPEEAVLMEGPKHYVFVQVSADRFQKRGIETGRAFGKSLEVTGGLKEGEKVAVKGSYILKSEMKKDELGE